MIWKLDWVLLEDDEAFGLRAPVRVWSGRKEGPAAKPDSIGVEAPFFPIYGLEFPIVSAMAILRNLETLPQKSAAGSDTHETKFLV